MIEFSGNRREYTYLVDEYAPEIMEILKSGQFLQGKHLQNIEQVFSGMFKNNTIYSVGVGSGTDALYFGLSYFKQPLKIAVPSISFIATAVSIVRAGHFPVFVNVNDNGLLTEEILEPLANKVDAVLHVSLYGNNETFAQVSKFCENNDLLFFEDAAQSDLPGSYYYTNCRPAIFSALSFDPMKILSAPGSGGMLLTPDPTLYEHVQQKQYHGRGTSNLGFNSQLSELTSFLVARKKTLHFKAWKKRREKICKYLNSNLHHGISSLCQPMSVHALHKFVIKCENKKLKDELIRNLSSAQIEYKIHYPFPMYEHAIFKDRPHSVVGSKIMNSRFCNHVVTIPNYPLLTDNEVDRICSVISQV